MALQLNQLNKWGSKAIAFTALVCASFLIVLFLSASSIVMGDEGFEMPEKDKSDNSTCRPTICIDPGHGGTANGSSGCGLGALGWDDMQQIGKIWRYNNSKYPNEKDFNLAISLRLNSLFRKFTDYNVVMTRNADYCVSLKRRVQIANANNCTIFVSIHNNAAGSSSSINPRESGTETLYKSAEDRELASAIQPELVRKINRRNRGLIYRDNLYVLNQQPKRPSALVEVGFVTNSTEFYNLSNPRFQQLAALGIYNGIQLYLENTWQPMSACSSNKSEPPRDE